MQALIDRVMAMSEAVGIAPAGQGAGLGNVGAPPSRTGVLDAAHATPQAAPIAVGVVPTAGAQWIAAADRSWWRWSWLDRQWQPAPPPGGPVPAGTDGWVHWVEGLDGRWARAAAGPNGAPWPTPTAP
jgi:hypothetical protein